MQIVERQFEKFANTMRPASIYRVPNYIVGSNQLLFFYNGQLCVNGDSYQYTEIGINGNISSEINVNFNFEINSEVIIIIIPLNK
jgi:hypothetical protein